MKKLRATLIDADYITKGEKAIIRLILKKKRFFKIVLTAVRNRVPVIFPPFVAIINRHA